MRGFPAHPRVWDGRLQLSAQTQPAEGQRGLLASPLLSGMAQLHQHAAANPGDQGALLHAWQQHVALGRSLRCWHRGTCLPGFLPPAFSLGRGCKLGERCAVCCCPRLRWEGRAPAGIGVSEGNALMEREGRCGHAPASGLWIVFLASLQIWPAGVMLLLLKITSSGNAESRTPDTREIE